MLLLLPYHSWSSHLSLWLRRPTKLREALIDLAAELAGSSGSALDPRQFGQRRSGRVNPCQSLTTAGWLASLTSSPSGFPLGCVRIELSPFLLSRSRGLLPSSSLLASPSYPPQRPIMAAVLWYILTRDYAFTRESRRSIEPVSGAESNGPNFSTVNDIDASNEADRVLLTLLPRRAGPSADFHLSPSGTELTPHQRRQRAGVVARIRLPWEALEAHNLRSLFAPTLAASSASLIRAVLRTLSAHSLDEVEQAVVAVARRDADQNVIDGKALRQNPRATEESRLLIKAKL